MSTKDLRTTEKNGILLDRCGSSERLYDFGLHYDLCGMSIEDYIESNKYKCCCHTDEEGGGGDTPVTPSKKINTITFTTNSEGYLVAYTTYAPTMNITVTCIYEGTSLRFVFPANGSSIIASNVNPANDKIMLTDVVIEPSEDDKYKYGDYTIVDKVADKETTVLIPNLTINFKDLSNISNIELSDLSEQVVDKDGATLSYVFPAVEELPENFHDEDFDYDAWRIDNSYVPVVLLEKEKFDNKVVKIYIGTNNMSQYFKEIATKTINGVVYSVLVKTTTDSTDQYIVYGDIWVNSFSADEESNVEYIIKEQK